MGNNKISVDVYSSMVFMETGDGASIAVSPAKDMGRMLYDYCARRPVLITGVTAQGYAGGLAGGAFLFSVLLGIGFGLYPAAKASGLTPVEALRSE